jgi:hypothetical protein
MTIIEEESISIRINSLEECKDYFIKISRPDPVKHIDDFNGTGVLLKKYITSPFGFVDNKYYYLVFRRDGWFNGWASENLARVTKYRNQPGCTISSRIYAHMLTHPRFKYLGAMVIGFGDGSFHYIRCLDFIRFVKKYGTEFESTRFPGQIDVGLAAEYTNTNDPLVT